MSGIIKIALISIILLVGDTIVSVLFASAYGFVTNFFFNEVFGAEGMAGGALALALMRLAFYYVLFVVLFYWLNKKLNLDNKILKLVLINCGLYILISLLFGLVLMPETKHIFTNPLFTIIIISTIVSPLLLSKIQAFRTLYDSVQRS